MASDERTTTPIVIGAGFAGLSAAVRLARRGARVLVLEARAGSAGARRRFSDRETGELVDNGQHVLLGCYRETFAFLERDRRARQRPRCSRSSRVTMIDRAGRRSRGSMCPALPAPFHLLAGRVRLGRARPGGIGCRCCAWRTPLRLARRELEPGATRDRRVAGRNRRELADSQRSDRRGCARCSGIRWRWPRSISRPSQAAAPPFARVLAEMFGPRPAGGGDRAADAARCTRCTPSRRAPIIESARRDRA